MKPRRSTSDAIDLAALSVKLTKTIDPLPAFHVAARASTDLSTASEDQDWPVAPVLAHPELDHPLFEDREIDSALAITGMGEHTRMLHNGIEITPPQIEERKIPFTPARPDPIEVAGHAQGRAVEMRYAPKSSGGAS
jgi:hypothetical protein